MSEPKGYIWDSESDNTPSPIEKDRYFIGLDNDNGVLRLDDQDLGARSTSILFLGPNAKENAERWAAYAIAKAIDDADGDFLVDTLIKDCFGLN
jgi:hypothetical protein